MSNDDLGRLTWKKKWIFMVDLGVGCSRVSRKKMEMKGFSKGLVCSLVRVLVYFSGEK